MAADEYIEREWKNLVKNQNNPSAKKLHILEKTAETSSKVMYSRFINLNSGYWEVALRLEYNGQSHAIRPL